MWIDVFGGKAVEPEIDVGGGDPFDMEPNVPRPTVSNKILILVLVPADVTCNVLQCQRDVGMGVPALSAANGVVNGNGLV